MVRKLGRKHNVPFKRGKLENWASGVIYAISQLNFRFDQSQEMHTSPDEICDFFNAKKSTASNKARDIRKLLNLNIFDEEFTSKEILDEIPVFLVDERTGMIIPVNRNHKDELRLSSDEDEDKIDLEELSNEFSLLDNWMDIDSEDDSIDLFGDSLNPLGDNPSKYEDLFDKSFELCGYGRITEALEIVDTVPKDNSEDHGRALFYKAIFLDKSGDEEESSKTLDESLKILIPYGNDDDIELMKSFYEMYKSLLNDMERISKELDLKPDDEEYFDDGVFDYELEDYEDAILNFEKSLKYNPNQSEAYCYIAMSFNHLDEMDNALENIDKAIEMDSQRDKYWNERGMILTKMENYNEAEESFDKAIELNPNDPVLFSNKGFLYKENEEYEKAVNAYDKAMELDSNDITFIVGKASAYLGMNDADKAKELLDIAEEMDSNNIEYLIEKGFYYLHVKNYEEAIKAWDKCLEIDERQIKVWFYKTLAYNELDDYEKIDECLNKAYEIDPIACISIGNSIIDDD